MHSVDSRDAFRQFAMGVAFWRCGDLVWACSSRDACKSRGARRQDAWKGRRHARSGDSTRERIKFPSLALRFAPDGWHRLHLCQRKLDVGRLDVPHSAHRTRRARRLSAERRPGRNRQYRPTRRSCTSTPKSGRHPCRSARSLHNRYQRRSAFRSTSHFAQACIEAACRLRPRRLVRRRPRPQPRPHHQCRRKERSTHPRMPPRSGPKH